MQHCIRIRALSSALKNVYICKCSKRRNEATPLSLFSTKTVRHQITFPFLQRWDVKQKNYVFFIFGHQRALFIPSIVSFCFMYLCVVVDEVACRIGLKSSCMFLCFSDASREADQAGLYLVIFNTNSIHDASNSQNVFCAWQKWNWKHV